MKNKNEKNKIYSQEFILIWFSITNIYEIPFISIFRLRTVGLSRFE